MCSLSNQMDNETSGNAGEMGLMAGIQFWTQGQYPDRDDQWAVRCPS